MTDKIGSKEAQLRELKAARSGRQRNLFQDVARGRDPVRNTPEASGTTRKVPGGPVCAGPSREANSARQPVTAVREKVQRGEAEHSSRLVSNPVAKATKGKARSAGKSKGSRKTPITPPGRVASRLGAGRTAQDRSKLARPAAVAIRSPRAERAPASVPADQHAAANRSAPKRGPGRPKIAGKRPWETAGLSKRTYYRRKAEGTL